MKINIHIEGLLTRKENKKTQTPCPHTTFFMISYTVFAIVIPFRDSFMMKLFVWTLTNDTSYNETSLSKRRFGHRFELKLNKESRLITEMLCVDRESVTSVTNWVGA